MKLTTRILGLVSGGLLAATVGLAGCETDQQDIGDEEVLETEDVEVYEEEEPVTE